MKLLLHGLVFLLVSSQVLCYDQQRDSLSQSQMDNLVAFTKLYGYVRYFHPSDEASTIDWDKLAIYGAGRVKEVQGMDELHRELEAIFLPIAPTLQIYPTGQSSPAPSPQLVPADTAGLELVAWQHKGVGFGHTVSAYRSRRLNRTRMLRGYGFGTFSQAVDATPYRGKQVKLMAKARTEVARAAEWKNNAYFIVELWLRVEGTDGVVSFSNVTITASDWTRYAVMSPVADNATKIIFGASAELDIGWFDDFQLLIVDDAGNLTPIPIENASFESVEADEAPPGWDYNGYSASFKSAADSVRDGLHVAVIAPTLIDEVMNESPFEQHPQPGELVNKALGAGLSVQLPIALYSKNGHTIGLNEDHPFENIVSALESIDLNVLTAVDEDLRFAGVLIAWNVFQHFYPYFDVVQTDWDSVLASTLTDARNDVDTREFLRTLRKMVAQLEDGHGRVYHPVDSDQARPLFRVKWVENQVVVVATADESRFQIGDVVVAIDGVPAERVLQDIESRRSGSPQYKRDKALWDIANGLGGTEVRLVLERGDERIEVTATRNLYRGGFPARRGTVILPESRPRNVEEIQDGIWYVNLGRARWSEINERIQELATAQGIVFDGRKSAGYPWLLGHLTDTPLRSAHWQIPQIIYPDQENLVGYDTTGRWTIEPRTPRFTGKAVFLISSRAVSGSESFLGIVENYRLGEIVGQPTAGANGNANLFAVPGGYTLKFTGMRVIKHDDSQHHLIGILPTIPMKQTIAGIRAGRDEFLEKAIEILGE